MKRGALIGVEMVTREFVTRHATNGMDEILTEQIFEPVLVRIVCVGTTVEIVCRRILATLLITCILGSSQYTSNEELKTLTR